MEVMTAFLLGVEKLECTRSVSQNSGFTKVLASYRLSISGKYCCFKASCSSNLIFTTGMANSAFFSPYMLKSPNRASIDWAHLPLYPGFHTNSYLPRRHRAWRLSPPRPNGTSRTPSVYFSQIPYLYFYTDETNGRTKRPTKPSYPSLKSLLLWQHAGNMEDTASSFV